MSKTDLITLPIEQGSELSLLKAKLAKAEEEVEVSQYNNTRLARRLEEVMSQLKNTVTSNNIIRI
jgi:hypothetical protein